MVVHLVFGGAGFIGSNLIRYLLRKGKCSVLCIDNFSRGSLAFVEDLLPYQNFNLLEVDISDHAHLTYEMEKFQHLLGNDTVVWHLAANSDIPAGVADIQIDFKDTLATTISILRWMKQTHLKKLCFASSSAIYGDHGIIELHENIGGCLPISNYGAMKLASEAAISAASESFLRQAIVFRFPNIVGVPATHGVIYDFVYKILKTPECLNVLGNGTQKKLYLHVADLVDAMIFLQSNKNLSDKINIFNIGPGDDGISVREIAEIVASLFHPKPTINYGVEDRGWVGDVPKFRYSIKKLNKLGWKPELTSAHAINKAAVEIREQIV